MHVVGVVREGNQSVELDVRLQGQQGVALIRTNGATVRVVKVGSHVYVQGDDTFYEQFGGAEMARLLTGKWLKGSSSHPPLARSPSGGRSWHARRTMGLRRPPRVTFTARDDAAVDVVAREDDRPL